VSRKFFAAVGVGCFNFGIRARTSDTLDFKAYLDQIKTTLEALPAIGEVSIEPSPDVVENGDVEVPKQLPRLDQGEGCFPGLPYQTRIEFSLFIPVRMQRELNPFAETGLGEHFKVQMVAGWYGFPIAFVEPQEPTDEAEPSAAVAIVRNFLQQQLNEKNTGSLAFQYLGPSPFHADVYIFDRSTRETNSDDVFTVEYVPRRAYDTILIGMNLSDSRRREAAIASFIDAALDELNLFYDIVQDHAARLTKWHSISHSINDLSVLLKGHGMRAAIARLRRLSKAINDVTISLAEFQADVIEKTDSIREHYTNVYRPDRRRPFFKPFVDREMQERQTYPVRELSELIRFAEARRTLTLQILVNIIVGILGGIAGAVTTLLLQK